LSFQDRSGILSERRLSNVAGLRYTMLYGKSQVIIFLGFTFIYVLASIYFSVIVIKYMFSIAKLLKNLEEHQPDLWNKLGKPRFTPSIRVMGIQLFPNGHTTLSSQFSFMGWFLSAKPDFKTQSTNDRIIKSKMFFKKCLYGLISLFVYFGILTIFCFTMLPSVNK